MDFYAFLAIGLIFLVIYATSLTVIKIKKYSELKKLLQKCELKLVETIANYRKQKGYNDKECSSQLLNEWVNDDTLTKTASLLHSIRNESKARRIFLSSQFILLLSDTILNLESMKCQENRHKFKENKPCEDSEQNAFEQSGNSDEEENSTLNSEITENSNYRNMSAEMLYELGKKFRIGIGVTRDPQKAFTYFKMSAEKGSIDGKTCVATCYMDGTGVQKDVDKAYSRLKTLSEEGHLKATVNLGICYFNGLGVSKDIPHAFKLFQFAAESGDPQAKCNLGSFYQHGCWVKQNHQTAVKYFKEAAETGNSDAIYNLGRCYHNGEGIEKNGYKAIQLYEDASKKGCTLSVCTLAHCYETGSGVPQDKKKAFELYRKAADRGNIFAKSRVEQGLHQTSKRTEGKIEFTEGIPGEL